MELVTLASVTVVPSTTSCADSGKTLRARPTRVPTAMGRMDFSSDFKTSLSSLPSGGKRYKKRRGFPAGEGCVRRDLGTGNAQRPTEQWKAAAELRPDLLLPVQSEFAVLFAQRREVPHLKTLCLDADGKVASVRADCQRQRAGGQ